MKELLKYCKEHLAYDPETGDVTWRKRVAKCIHVGDVAGTIDGYGYIQIRMRGKSYKAHRIAFLITHGYLPETVDHANGIKDDNRIKNLRAATSLQQQRNRRPAKNNKSGYKGVCWHPPMSKWKAYIKVKGKNLHLGYHLSKHEAANSYNEAAKIHHKEFAYINKITS